MNTEKDLQESTEQALTIPDVICSPILAKIEHINDLGKSKWYEVDYYKDGSGYPGCAEEFEEGVIQDNKSYYRGQIEKPTIDNKGNLVLYAREDELYKKAGLKSKGVSMTDDLKSAIDYGNGQLEVAQNLLSETYDADSELEKLSENGYYLIQIPKNISNETVKEAGEVKVIGDKIIIPKGQYKIEQITNDDNQITLQQKQQAQQQYSQYLESLNKPNTNPILQGNQQEQVKKFAELQERLNNKEFLEGAKFAYESSDGLKKNGYKNGNSIMGKLEKGFENWSDEYYPTNILNDFSNAKRTGRLHPTQKPLELIEYMIKTYTNEGDLILDNTCGSGTTGLGAKNLNRDYIMMEQDPEYYEIACKRVLKHH